MSIIHWLLFTYVSPKTSLHSAFWSFVFWSPIQFYLFRVRLLLKSVKIILHSNPTVHGVKNFTIPVISGVCEAVLCISIENMDKYVKRNRILSALPQHGTRNTIWGTKWSVGILYIQYFDQLLSSKWISDQTPNLSFSHLWTLMKDLVLWSFLSSVILDSILKSRDITLPTKVRLVKAMVFLVVMYGCESWTVKKAEHQRMDAFELWCWRRLLRVPWTARRSNQSILKEISPGCSWKEWC